MKRQSRRQLLMGATTAAAAGIGSLVLSPKASAQSNKPLEKRDAKARPGTPKPAKPPVYTDVVAYGNLLFLAGKSQHEAGTIEEHTKFVLDTLEKSLIASGSSMRKVLKVNVYL